MTEVHIRFVPGCAPLFLCPAVVDDVVVKEWGLGPAMLLHGGGDDLLHGGGDEAVALAVGIEKLARILFYEGVADEKGRTGRHVIEEMEHTTGHAHLLVGNVHVASVTVEILVAWVHASDEALIVGQIVG